ncbi:MAG TPA: Mov34/MPN/PAD-1 family protein [Polyangiaceae bacterium]|nr:Mov34/MPN/PAD-1 family protein [Polyangiaceae bacterium]
MLLKSHDARFTVVVARIRMRELLARCARAGRNETGGILVGLYSADRECATVTEIVSAPDDSESGRAWFHRGIRDLAKRLSTLWRGSTPTYYVGEWHFHPFASPIASAQDMWQLGSIARDDRYRCPEPILLIVGGNPKKDWQIAAYVATASEVITLHEQGKSDA